MKKTILAVGAHHDDIEFRAGGTLAKYALEGWKVIYVVAATTPHYEHWPENRDTNDYPTNNEVIKLRKNEAREAAGILGASEVHFLDYKSIYWYREGTRERVYLDGVHCTSSDLSYLENWVPGREFIVSAHRVKEAVGFMADFLSSCEPDIVLTHSADDSHWEHYATANLLCTAVCSLAENGRKPKLYGWEFSKSSGWRGTMNYGFAPTRFVDISDTIETKYRALKVFKSQFHEDGIKKIIARERKRAEAYGKLCGFTYAEPFVDFNLDGRDTGAELVFPPNYLPPETIEGL